MSDPILLEHMLAYLSLNYADGAEGKNLEKNRGIYFYFVYYSYWINIAVNLDLASF